MSDCLLLAYFLVGVFIARKFYCREVPEKVSLVWKAGWFWAWISFWPLAILNHHLHFREES
ncbi:MAG: hypothetical protein MI807_06305 [Verrucomicrobiales bacterium]|nr:hypothetical protein [Verrucomicrobiales bacterium]